SIATVNVYGDYHFPVKHSLFFEFAGAKDAVEAQVELVRELMEDIDCEDWTVAESTKERNELWRARHEMAYAYQHKHGIDYLVTDVCVPISQLPNIIHYARKLIEENNIDGGILGHVGDGNFHTILTFQKDNESERNLVQQV